MAKAVIFDVDGTLVDSVDLHAQAWRDAFADWGFEFDLKRIRDQIGKGGDQLLPVFLTPEQIEEHGKKLEEHRGHILKERYLHQIQPFPSVPALFRRILDDGRRVALASSAKGDELQFYKERAGIADLIHAETSSSDAERSKPHPDIFQAALERLGLSPADAVVVGDTPYDAEAAGKAGVRTIGLMCGGWTEAQLRDAGCVAVFRDPADLLARYDESPIVRDVC